MLSDWTPQACCGQRRVACTARQPCWPTWRWHIRASWRRDSCSLPVRLTCFNLCAACLKDDLHREIALRTIWMDPILDLGPSPSPTRSHLPLHAPGLLPIFLLLLSSRLFRIALICGPHIPGHCRPVACRFRPHPANARSLSSFRLDTFDRSSKILTTY